MKESKEVSKTVLEVVVCHSFFFVVGFIFEIFFDFEIFEKSKMKGVWMIFMILWVCCQSVPTILSSRASMRGFEMDEVRSFF